MWEIPLLNADARKAVNSKPGMIRAAGYPSAETIHGLFEEQAKARPSRIAVKCGEEPLTFAELNIRANQFAHLLRHRECSRTRWLPFAWSAPLRW